MNAPVPAQRPGRVCPLDYAYAPASFARPAEVSAPALYVAGGIYGNLQALAVAEALVRAEPGAVLVLNGDFHWFDAEPGWFAEVERIAARHPALRGNVETELARGVDPETGCGCAYPATIDEGTVTRSNAIIAQLARAVGGFARERLAALPMHLVATVGPARIGIVHGDAESLAGWRFDRAALDDEGERAWLENVRRESGVDVFASSHTCAPALRRFELPSGAMAVANNGAAGMPNGLGPGLGVMTRIGVAPSPVEPLYGLESAGVHVDALALAYEHRAFLAMFDALWPAGSPSALSYRERIVGACGPDPALAEPRVS